MWVKEKSLVFSVLTSWFIGNGLSWYFSWYHKKLSLGSLIGRSIQVSDYNKVIAPSNQ